MGKRGLIVAFVVGAGVLLLTNKRAQASQDKPKPGPGPQPSPQPGNAPAAPSEGPAASPETPPVPPPNTPGYAQPGGGMYQPSEGEASDVPVTVDWSQFDLGDDTERAHAISNAMHVTPIHRVALAQALADQGWCDEAQALFTSAENEYRSTGYTSTADAVHAQGVNAVTECKRANAEAEQSG